MSTIFQVCKATSRVEPTVDIKSNISYPPPAVKYFIRVVGFEPTTSSTQNSHAKPLRYTLVAPKVFPQLTSLLDIIKSSSVASTRGYWLKKIWIIQTKLFKKATYTKNLQRKRGFEPPTFALARQRSTFELFPLFMSFINLYITSTAANSAASMLWNLRLAKQPPTTPVSDCPELGKKFKCLKMQKNTLKIEIRVSIYKTLTRINLGL